MTSLMLDDSSFGDALDFVVGTSSDGILYVAHDVEPCGWHHDLMGSWRFYSELIYLAKKHMVDAHGVKAKQ